MRILFRVYRINGLCNNAVNLLSSSSICFLNLDNVIFSMSEEGQTGSNIEAIQLMWEGSISGERMAAAGRLSFDLVNMIQQEIAEDQIEVSEVQKNFKLKAKEGKKEEQSQHDGQKQRKNYKSEMTQQDLQKIRMIKLEQRKQQIQMANKIRKNQEEQRRFQQQEKQLLEQQRQERNEGHRREAAKKIEEIRQRQEQRKKKAEEERKRVAILKGEKKLYERLEEEYRSAQMREERQKDKTLLSIRLQRVAAFGDLKEHEQKYEQTLRGQRQERERKLGGLRTGSLKKYYQSKFLKGVLEQEQKVRVQPLQRKQKQRQHLTKKDQYAQHVRTNYRPSIVEQQKNWTQDVPSARAVSVSELRKLGNNYMWQAHQHILPLKSSQANREEKQEEPFRYKDYLREQRVERKPQSQQKGRQTEQIDRVLKRQDLSQQEKMERGKSIAGKAVGLAASIHAKIHLLRQLQQQQ